MKENQICSKCVMDTTDSTITFDDNGVCNHCHLYEIKNNDFIDDTDKKQSLEKLVDRIKQKNRNKKYDCLIGISGGVDSTYVAYLVKEVLGLRPLAVHLDNGWNSELAVKNIENIVKKLDIDLYTHVIDWEEFKDIQLSFLKASTPDAEIPSDHAIFSIMSKISSKFKIKTILNGINSKTESHHPLSWSQGHIDYGYIKGIQKKFGTKKIKTFPHGNIFMILTNKLSSDWVSVLDYVDYNKKDAIKIITEKLNWRDYGGKHHESIYTRFFQGYILPKKFNIDKRKMHLSSLICAGELSRTKALEILKEEPYSIDLQKEDLDYVLKKFRLSKEEFDQIMNLEIKSYQDYPSYYGKILKSKLYKKSIKFIKSLI